MAGETFRWTNDGYDVHLIRGRSFVLSTILEMKLANGTTTTPWFNVVGGSPPFPRPAGVTVVFTTLNKTFTAGVHGVTVEGLTGRIDSFAVGDPNHPPPAVRNFIVTATVNGAIVTPAPKPLRLHIRIFLHDSLTAVRVSPPTLHIAAGTNAGFSALGTFSDGPEGTVIGDLTRHPDPGTWAVSTTPPSNSTDVRAVISANGPTIFRVVASPGTPNVSATIQYTLPASLQPNPQLPTAEGTVVPDPGWGSRPDEAMLVEPVGGTVAGDYPNTKNVLFLPDGFVGEGEQGRIKFNRAVEVIYNEFRDSPSISPFNLVTKSNALSFYKAWISSPEEGGTILNDLAKTGTGLNIDKVKIPRDPLTLPDPGFLTDVADLVWAVGLPTKTRAARTSFDDQLNEWTTLFGAFATPPSALMELWTEWKMLYPRYQAIERDTAFGIAYGVRPRATPRVNTFGQHVQSERIANLSDARVSLLEVTPFLERLRLASEAGNANSQRIGRIWVDSEVTGRGPDFGRVVIVTNMPIETGVSSIGRIVMALVERKTRLFGGLPSDAAFVDPVIFELASRRLPVDPKNPTAPPKIEYLLPHNVKAIATHELGHGFNLGDEYAETTGAAAANIDLTTDWNLISTTQAGVANSTTNPIKANKIPWNLTIIRPTSPPTPRAGWKRIRAAGVLLLLPTLVSGSSNRFVFHLRPGHGRDFAKLQGARVRLRRRPLVVVSPAIPYPDIDFESDQFKLVTVEGDRLEGEVDVPTSNVIRFIDRLSPPASPPVPETPPRVAPGSPSEVIIMAPTMTKETTPRELGLMHELVARQIETSNSPLNRLPGKACAYQTAHEPQAPVNLFPAGIPPLNYVTRVVGLYDGGSTFACGVYHPQGICHMRDQHEQSFDAQGIVLVDLSPVMERKQATEFCPVCRYLLVDQIDPSQHGTIDKEYENQYPGVL